VVSSFAIAENAAEQLRKIWNLGYDPIPDVVEMLEDKGYRVVEIEAPASFDGMKAQIDQKNVIVLRKTSTDYNNVRKRFTALHELAHHVLTFPTDIEQKEEEKLCHAFASAFLYPKEMILKELCTSRNHILVNELVLIKERWGISLPAIIYRAQHLGIINENFAKSFHINYRKYKMHEPGNEPGTFQSKEKPTLFDRLIYLALSKELITINEAAYFANTTAWQFQSKIRMMA
jgi:Zn-dependent peptidase ImmA (M78 family)